MNCTISDIAEKAGTTIGVVSVTLNGAKSKTLRVGAATRARVLHAAEELGYRRDPRASALATGRNFVIGLMLPYVSSFAEPDPFYSLLTAGVATVASCLGYNLMLYTAVAEEEGARAVETIDRRIDGLILVLPPAISPIYEECRRQGIATVAIIQNPQFAPVTVNSNDYEGARLAVGHLLEFGHRRIAHLSGNEAICTTQPRRQAYIQALKQAGICPDPDLIRNGSFNRAVSRSATSDLLRLPAERRPTAIFAGNDLSAHGVIEAIQESGLRIPQDISVIGYDDTWYASITNPPLTTVNMSVDLMGRRAAEILIGKVEGRHEQNHSILPVSLTIRGSTGPAPSHNKGILQ